MGWLHRGCLSDYDYMAKLARAGFDSIDIEPTRVYDIEDARNFLSGQGVDVDAITNQVPGEFYERIRSRDKACRVLRARLLPIRFSGAI